MRFKAVRGVKDVLPEELTFWQEIERVARGVFELYGYEEIRTPVFESSLLFERGIGEGTEIVDKQMYTFLDKKGRNLTLRPEATASVVRAYLEHNLDKKGNLVQFYYIGPMFRYERPQAGRQRQFWQLGTELFGSSHPARDAELIGMTLEFFKELGLENLITEINSVGCLGCRGSFVSALHEYLQKEKGLLCSDCQIRLEKNPLRILDCKSEPCKSLVLEGPDIERYLCSGCHSHLKKVEGYLDLLDVSYKMNSHLVRGLDYYTRTVFEIIDRRLGSQDALAAGGRYDELVKELGGPSTPAIGFAAGMERIVLALKKDRKMGDKKEKTDFFIASIDEAADGVVLKIAHSLRTAGLHSKFNCESRSAKSQAQLANKLGARFLIIIGEDELRNEEVRPKDMSVRKLLDPVDLSGIVSWCKEVL
ncbi:TPA: histidine--tRNA ligase [bacterium]|nr:histidine--tRNA ligase [bacterium]